MKINNIFCKINIHNYEYIRTEKAKGLYKYFYPITREVIKCKICGKIFYKQNKKLEKYNNFDLEWIKIKD